MFRFQEGKTYLINGGGRVTITKRTAHYVVIDGTNRSGMHVTGRKKIYEDNLFGLGEHINIESFWGPAMHYFCFAGHVSE